MTEEEIQRQAWLVEMAVMPRTDADFRFWQEHRSKAGGGRSLIPALSDEYLAGLHAVTTSPSFRAALWREIRDRRRNKLFGRGGKLSLAWRSFTRG